MARRSSEQCDIDMTPMIDVVFQLIIFFVVTIKFSSDVNPDIFLEDGKHGETLTQDNMPPSTPRDRSGPARDVSRSTTPL
ncbi:MAG: ExbD/TolR family protein [Kiritimatiellia bacterium]